MKVSTRGQYGVRAMIELALNYGQGPMPLKTIAEKQELSEHYLEQLLGALRKAGLVSSVRGAYGGYELNKSPEDILVGDIVRVLEGPIAPVECVAETTEQVCSRIDCCATHLLWDRLREAIENVLDSVTLEDLCDKAREMQPHNDYMYYI